MLSNLGDLWVKNPLETSLLSSFERLEQDIISFIDQYSKYENILVFGHGMWLRGIMCYLEDKSLKNINTFFIENNKLEIISF